MGRFVLAELLRRKIPVAVIVRADAGRVPAARVDEALAPFEEFSLLPRPKVIAGDLSVPGLGLHADDRSLLSSRPLTIIHCAASVKFFADGNDGEPYRSNVDGTRHLLEMCKTWQISRFHLVSTAYTQSAKRVEGTAFEVPVSPDLAGENDYECSKIKAEALVRSCPWLQSPTILRPSIVVGDSLRAYTSSYNGFYSALQIGEQFAKSFGFDPLAGGLLRQALGLRASDSKNLVPVDWVAAAIVRIALHASLRGQIYHLTNSQPVSVLEIERAIVDGLADKHGHSLPHTRHTSTGNSPVTDVPTLFREQMRAYSTYFADDPKFDTTHADELLGDLPCPQVDYRFMRELCRVALEKNFGWPKPPRLLYQRVEFIKGNVSSQKLLIKANDVAESWILELLGPGAPPPLTFTKSDNRWQVGYELVDAEEMPHKYQRMVTSVSTFLDCINGTIGLNDSVRQGRWVIQSRSRQNWLAELEQWIHDIKLLVSVTGPDSGKST